MLAVAFVGNTDGVRLPLLTEVSPAAICRRIGMLGCADPVMTSETASRFRIQTTARLRVLAGIIPDMGDTHGEPMRVCRDSLITVVMAAPAELDKRRSVIVEFAQEVFSWLSLP